MENLDNPHKKSTDDLCLIKMLNRPSLWKSVTDKMEQNVSDIIIYLQDWIHMFDNKTAKDDNSTQTDFPPRNTRDMGTQSSCSESKLKEFQRSSED